MADQLNDFLRGVSAGDELSALGKIAARRIASHMGFRKEYANDAMIAWYPPAEVAAALAMPGGEAPEDLHVTLVYIPADLNVDPELVRAVTKIVTQWQCDMDGALSGVGRFVLDDVNDCFFVTVDVPGLDELRRRLRDELCEVGVYVPETHGFTPHITLQYLTRDQDSPADGLVAAIPVTVSSVTVATRDGLRQEYQLGGAFTGADECTTEDEQGALVSLMKRDYSAEQRQGMADKGEAMPDGSYPIKTKNDLSNAIQAVGRAKDPDKAREHVIARARALDAVSSLPEDWNVEKSVVDDEPNEDAIEKGAPLCYAPLTKDNLGDWQYTLGPVYAPNMIDAHDEFVDPEDLHKAMIQYSLNNDRSLRLQHDTSKVAGTWVEMMTWPYEHTVTLTKADGTTSDVTMPAGTTYMGVLWNDDTWPLVKSGRIGGFSMGGRAVRVDAGSATMPIMGENAVQPSVDVASTAKAAALDAVNEVLSAQAASQPSNSPVNVYFNLPEMSNVNSATPAPRSARAHRDPDTGEMVVNYDLGETEEIDG